MGGLLPSRPALHAAEALDGYLERLADVNGISPAALHKLIVTELGAASAALTFFMIRPHPAAIALIADLSGIDDAALGKATLLRYDEGLPLRLHGFDPRRRHTYRWLVAQGWFPPHGSQACPSCLAHDGIWKVEWRLPLITVCRTHKVNLLSECIACKRRFRTRRHSPLRSRLGPDQICGNPTGVRQHCGQPIVAHQAEPAAEVVVAVTERIADALAGGSLEMLGQSVDPRVFLAELRHVATMLLHLLDAAGDSGAPEWAELFRAEHASRGSRVRNSRWGICPPRSAALRGYVLAEAASILGRSTLSEAGGCLRSWLTMMPEGADGPNNWLRNRTTCTSTTQQLIAAAAYGRHHVGRRLDTVKCASPLAIPAIPQLIDEELFHKFFDGMLGGYQCTGRMYVSLCVARSITAVTRWSAAAAQLGLDPVIGWRAARAASGRMRATPEAFAKAVLRTVAALPRDRDFRRRESRVVELAREPAVWFERWRTAVTPARKRATLPYAITWMWCGPAQGSLDTSPAWQISVSGRTKAGYREFRDRLTPACQAGLQSLILDDTSC